MATAWEISPNMNRYVSCHVSFCVAMFQQLTYKMSNVRRYARHGIYQGTSSGIACVLAHQLLVLQMAVDLVVDPAEIDTNLNDIGGLDDILERLVGHC